MIFRYDNERDKIYFSKTPDQKDRAVFERHVHAIQEECGVSGHHDRMESVFRELANTGTRMENPFMIYDESDTRLFKCHLIPEFDAAGKITSIICISQDITEMMDIIDTVCLLKKEKETMLRELHDRVKNNLQIIESLLRLQANRINDSNYYSLYENYVNRIHSIALIQNRLYQENNIEVVDMGAYICDFISAIESNELYRRKNVLIDSTVDSDKIQISVAVPCALIINELVNNSLQHAFKDGGYGRISICFICDAGETAHILEVSDNGIGLPEHVDCYNPSTMGLELVQALVRQIKGKLSISRNNGTHYRITF